MDERLLNRIEEVHSEAATAFNHEYNLLYDIFNIIGEKGRKRLSGILIRTDDVYSTFETIESIYKSELDDDWHIRTKESKDISYDLAELDSRTIWEIIDFCSVNNLIMIIK